MSTATVVASPAQPPGAGMARRLARNPDEGGVGLATSIMNNPQLKAVYDDERAKMDAENNPTPADEPPPSPAPAKAKAKAPAGPLSGLSLPKASLRAPRHLTDGPGFLLGLWLYAMALAYIRSGPAGPKQWLAAKFLNRTTAATPAKAATVPGGGANSKKGA